MNTAPEMPMRTTETRTSDPDTQPRRERAGLTATDLLAVLLLIAVLLLALMS